MAYGQNAPSCDPLKYLVRLTAIIECNFGEKLTPEVCLFGTIV